MSSVYILFSKTLDRYYMGMTGEDAYSRLLAHNSARYGNDRYTAQANDWELKLVMDCDDNRHALRLERKIKKMKSRKYLENLMKYEELREKITNQTR
ncbi:MAG: GIY-YIG nuclease family protein [Nonlabens sp.]